MINNKSIQIDGNEVIQDLDSRKETLKDRLKSLNGETPGYNEFLEEGTAESDI